MGTPNFRGAKLTDLVAGAFYRLWSQSARVSRGKDRQHNQVQRALAELVHAGDLCDTRQHAHQRSERWVNPVGEPV